MEPRIYLGAVLASFVAGLALTAGLNYRLDPAHVFDDGAYAASAARLMASGHDVLAANVDERLLQRQYSRTMERVPEVLMLGSSRVMSIDASMFPGTRFYNAGVSTATLPDLLAMGRLFVDRPRPPRLIVIGVDPWLLEAKPRNSRWQTLAPEYEAMLGLLGLKDRLEAPRRGLESILTLISIAYLERSWESLGGDFGKLWDGRDMQAVAADHWDRRASVRRADGSIGYGAEFRERSRREVRSAAMEQAAKHITAVLRADPLAAPSIEAFERYLRWLRSRGVRVVLLLAPFYPDYYAYLSARDQSRSLERITDTMRGLSQHTGATVVGSFDPGVAGCTAGEFWDGMHARPACLRRILHGVDTQRDVGR